MKLTAVLASGMVGLFMIAVTGCATDYGPDVSRLQAELDAAEERITRLEELQRAGTNTGLVTDNALEDPGARNRDLASYDDRALMQEFAECILVPLVGLQDEAANAVMVDWVEKALWVSADPHDFDESRIRTARDFYCSYQ